jgi:hypothetical protein
MMKRAADKGTPFILLEIAAHAAAPGNANDPVPSEAPENRPDRSSEMSDGRGDEFQSKPRSCTTAGHGPE